MNRRCRLRAHRVRRGRRASIGPSTEVSGDVPAHASETAYLWANVGTVTVRVTYEATLDGGCASYYKNRCQGHYDWWMDIGAMLECLGRPARLAVTEELTINLSDDAAVEKAAGAYDPNHHAPSAQLQRKGILLRQGVRKALSSP